MVSEQLTKTQTKQVVDEKYQATLKRLTENGYMATKDKGKSYYLTRKFLSLCQIDLNKVLTRMGLKSINLMDTISFQYSDGNWSG